MYRSRHDEWGYQYSTISLHVKTEDLFIYLFIYCKLCLKKQNLAVNRIPLICRGINLSVGVRFSYVSSSRCGRLRKHRSRWVGVISSCWGYRWVRLSEGVSAMGDTRGLGQHSASTGQQQTTNHRSGQFGMEQLNGDWFISANTPNTSAQSLHICSSLLVSHFCGLDCCNVG